jgi:alpha,alpha-trehalase
VVLIQTAGPLFEAVQLGHVFADSKTFVDALPKFDEATIAAEFARLTALGAEFDLLGFVHQHFQIAQVAPAVRIAATSADEYVALAWPSLIREHTTVPTGSTLIALPHPYVVPGGRFNELFYWDSYFTGLGLIKHGYVDLFAGMVDNFVHLQSMIGWIPNGSRTYLASRSQPPFLAFMVQALGATGRDTARYLGALLTEHTFWTTGDRIVESGGFGLSRYWDALDTPRPESHAEDVATADRNPTTCRHLRAAAESGWDFSSRWCSAGDPTNLATIETTDVIPIDLNCLLVVLELTIAGLSHSAGDRKQASLFRGLANGRIDVLRRHCFDKTTGWFHDLDRENGARRPHLTLAALATLVSGVADRTQATAMKDTLMQRFLAPGGLRTSLVDSGQQWDGANGWAPLQWWAIDGLRTYGFEEEAQAIADRWLATCRNRFLLDGTLLEKYNVDDPTKRPGGGEYVVQEGFGWTNGVLALLTDPVATHP